MYDGNEEEPAPWPSGPPALSLFLGFAPAADDAEADVMEIFWYVKLMEFKWGSEKLG